MENKKVAFIAFERRRLLDLVSRHADIVQNPRTDSTSLHRKNQAWDRITQEYNRHPNVRKRKTLQLRRLWQNEKARSKDLRSLKNKHAIRDEGPREASSMLM